MKTVISSKIVDTSSRFAQRGMRLLRANYVYGLSRTCQALKTAGTPQLTMRPTSEGLLVGGSILPVSQEIAALLLNRQVGTITVTNLEPGALKAGLKALAFCPQVEEVSAVLKNNGLAVDNLSPLPPSDSITAATLKQLHSMVKDKYLVTGQGPTAAQIIPALLLSPLSSLIEAGVGSYLLAATTHTYIGAGLIALGIISHVIWRKMMGGMKNMLTDMQQGAERIKRSAADEARFHGKDHYVLVSEFRVSRSTAEEIALQLADIGEYRPALAAMTLHNLGADYQAPVGGQILNALANNISLLIGNDRAQVIAALGRQSTQSTGRLLSRYLILTIQTFGPLIIQGGVAILTQLVSRPETRRMILEELSDINPPLAFMLGAELQKQGLLA